MERRDEERRGWKKVEKGKEKEERKGEGRKPQKT